MYDLSAKFNSFYSTQVVLPQDAQTELYHKKDLNIQRLKAGLEEYNEENHTSYNIVETCVQGSVAMSTVVQNEETDYDIDVAVVFDKDSLGDKGALATRNMVADALRRKTKQFNVQPEIKTSCIRVIYAENYHIDFAVYRRSWNETNNCWIYEHAGAEWSYRELRGLTDWFNNHNNASNGNLRKIVRLSKMFCKSRESWKNMPSGLLQTILCDEKMQGLYSRIDELFYYTMKEIVSRLERYTDVNAPIDNGRVLTVRQADHKKMTNWKNRLKSKLEDLDVLFKDDCTKEDALQAWYGFFNHEYWNEITSETSNHALLSKRGIYSFNETEQFIEDLFQVNVKHNVRVSCNVSGDGWRPRPIAEFLSVLGKFLPHNFVIRCDVCETTVAAPYDIYWKVKNVGPEAERRNMIRGQIHKGSESITEHTNFFGNHYIECYIVKNGICVARTRVSVPIGRR